MSMTILNEHKRMSHYLQHLVIKVSIVLFTFEFISFPANDSSMLSRILNIKLYNSNRTKCRVERSFFFFCFRFAIIYMDPILNKHKRMSHYL